MIRAASSAVALAALVLLVPAAARAGDIEDFEGCRAAYDARDYERAVICFEQLVGGESPRLASRPLVAEARKYLGAAYLFVGRRDAAREQLERLLREEPDYLLDPLRFPVDVQELFDSVRERLAMERREAATRAELEARAEQAEQRARDLLRFAEQEVTIESENSRWLALIPLGVGQFQNENDTLGWAFLVTELVLAGTAAGALIWWSEVNGLVQRTLTSSDPLERPPIDLAGANQQLTASFVTHWTALASLGAVTVAGLIEAQINFRPARVVTQRRIAPGELREGLEEDVPTMSDLRIGVGPGNISLSFRF